jgi:hypothetical protein
MLRPSIRTCLVVTLLILAAERSFAARAEAWTEVRSPNFLVLTDSNEKQGRRVALQFEMIRAVFRQFFNLPGAVKDPVVTIIAVQNENGLKRLMPKFWASKGLLFNDPAISSDPSGIYVAGPERDHIALRFDVNGSQTTFYASENVRHGYVHFLTRRMISQLPLGPVSQLPLWMVEGLAEFFGSTEVERGQLVVGAPSRTNLKVLLGTKLLPLSTLFAVDDSSPYYHEENRASIFYAQSWLLTKYLITRDWREGTHRVTDLVALLGRNVEPEEAARRTIGDPLRLQKELKRYLHRDLYTAPDLPLPPSLDANDFTAEPASPAESLAVRAEFMALDGHYAEAQKMVEEALQLDSKPAAHESMRFIFAAEFAAASAKTPDERRDAATRLAMARQQQEHQKGMEEESEMSDHPDYHEPPELEDSPKLAEGIIEKAECNGSTTIEVTVKTSSGEIHLYSDRYMKLFYSALNFTLEENMNPCRDLQGWHARISYRPAKDPANPGEMMAVLLVKD